MTEKMHIGKLIRDKLNENGQSASWLARKVHCDRSNFNKILKKNHMDTPLLLRISEVMDFDFFRYYSHLINSQEQEEK